MFSSRVVCIGALPGIGNVGKLAADYLSNALDCTTMKFITSSGFPQQVLIIDGCTRVLQVELKAPEERVDLYILNGDAQPVGVHDMYKLAGEILETARSMGVTDLITLAAYIGDAQGKVFGVATDPDLAKELENNGVKLLRNGFIGGLNGILVGLSPLHGMRGIGLLGSTSGEHPLDVKAANCVVQVTKQLLGLGIPLDGLDLTEADDEEKSTTSEDLDISYR
jgi:proteasome assembly chaperone (PAC2) family protein